MRYAPNNISLLKKAIAANYVVNIHTIEEALVKLPSAIHENYSVLMNLLLKAFKRHTINDTGFNHLLRRIFINHQEHIENLFPLWFANALPVTQETVDEAEQQFPHHPFVTKIKQAHEIDEKLARIQHQHSELYEKLQQPQVRLALLNGSAHLLKVTHDLLSESSATTKFSQDKLRMEAGPLAKHTACETLKTLCLTLLHDDDNYHINIEATGDIACILFPGDAPPQYYNLTLLLQNANLNFIHFETDELDNFIPVIPQVHDTLTLTHPTSAKTLSSPSFTEKQFHSTLASAIHLYTTDAYYHKMNALLRGYSNQLMSCDKSEFRFLLLLSVLTTFALKSFKKRLSETINEIKAYQRHKQQICEPLSFAACVQELVLQGIILEAFGVALKNSQQDTVYRLTKDTFYNPPQCGGLLEQGFFSHSAITPSVTDFGKQYHQLQSYKPLPYIAMLSHHKEEHEVLLSPGTQLFNLTQLNGSHYGLQIRTPALQRFTCPIMYEALRYACRHYLFKPYADLPDPFHFKEKTIHRHRHALPHTLRKIFYVEAVIEYLTNHANDSQLQHFCRHLTDKQQTTLQLILVFSVTGRQSEVSFHDDPELYNDYRKLSSKNFISYATSCLCPDFYTADEINNIAELIYYFANDEFDSSANIIVEPERNFYDKYRFMRQICVLTHQLDLWRVYPNTEYQSLLLQHVEKQLVTSTPCQMKDLAKLSHYACRAILTTGEQPDCNSLRDLPFVEQTGHYFSSRQNPQPSAERFANCSQNLSVCYALLSRINSPFQKIHLNAQIDSLFPGFIDLVMTLIDTPEELDNFLQTHVQEALHENFHTNTCSI